MQLIERLPGRWWGLIFPTLSGVFAIVLASAGDGQINYLWIGYAILAVIGIGWLVVGGKALDDGPLAMPFFVFLVIAVGVLCWLSPSMAFIQVLAYPYAWDFSQRRERNIIGNLAVGISVAIGLASFGGWTWPWVFNALATGGLSLAFSFAMGFWISAIAANAATQAVLRAKLDAVSEELAQAHRDAGAAAERERFAHEIHDTLTQTLTAIVMLTERAGDELNIDPGLASATLGVAERTARQALAETRSLIAEGRGLEVGGEGLATRLTRLCVRFGEEASITVTTHIGDGLDVLDRADQVVLLRCLQEVLANVRKHAHASTVSISLTRDGGSTALTVADNGVGFPDSVDAATARGYGLSGISSRLALTHGSLNIETGGDGTRVSIVLPTAAPEAAKTRQQAAVHDGGGEL